MALLPTSFSARERTYQLSFERSLINKRIVASESRRLGIVHIDLASEVEGVCDISGGIHRGIDGGWTNNAGGSVVLVSLQMSNTDGSQGEAICVSLGLLQGSPGGIPRCNHLWSHRALGTCHRARRLIHDKPPFSVSPFDLGQCGDWLHTIDRLWGVGWFHASWQRHITTCHK